MNIFFCLLSIKYTLSEKHFVIHFFVIKSASYIFYPKFIIYVLTTIFAAKKKNLPQKKKFCRKNCSKIKKHENKLLFLYHNHYFITICIENSSLNQNAIIYSKNIKVCITIRNSFSSFTIQSHISQFIYIFRNSFIYFNFYKRTSKPRSSIPEKNVMCLHFTYWMSKQLGLNPKQKALLLDRLCPSGTKSQIKELFKTFQDQIGTIKEQFEGEVKQKEGGIHEVGNNYHENVVHEDVIFEQEVENMECHEDTTFVHEPEVEHGIKVCSPDSKRQKLADIGIDKNSTSTINQEATNHVEEKLVAKTKIICRQNIAALKPEIGNKKKHVVKKKTQLEISENILVKKNKNECGETAQNILADCLKIDEVEALLIAERKKIIEPVIREKISDDQEPSISERKKNIVIPAVREEIEEDDDELDKFVDNMYCDDKDNEKKTDFSHKWYAKKYNNNGGINNGIINLCDDSDDEGGVKNDVKDDVKDDMTDDVKDDVREDVEDVREDVEDGKEDVKEDGKEDGKDDGRDDDEEESDGEEEVLAQGININGNWKRDDAEDVIGNFLDSNDPSILIELEELLESEDDVDFSFLRGDKEYDNYFASK